MRIDAGDACGLFYPAPAARGSIVVCPTIAGLNPYIESVGQRLAEAGFSSFVIDYHRGEEPPALKSLEAIVAAVGRLSDTTVVHQVEAARQWLLGCAGRPDMRTGVIGFCIGGTFAFHAACNLPDIAAAVVYYGSLDYVDGTDVKPIAPVRAADRLAAPLIAHYGTADLFVPSAHVDAFEVALLQSSRPFELFRYSGAPHAFDEEHKPAFRAVASAEAWRRSLAFLNWHIAGIPPR